MGDKMTVMIAQTLKKCLNTNLDYNFNPLATKRYRLLGKSVKNRGIRRGDSNN